MQTSVVNGLPIYQNEDVLDVTVQETAKMKALDTRVNYRFDTVAARNQAFTAYTSQGGVMVDGIQGSVAGQPLVYFGGQWHGIRPLAVATVSFFETTINDPGAGGNAETGVATLTISDPGVPYAIEASGAVTISATSGTQVNAKLRLDSTSGSIVSPVLNRSGQFPNGEPVSLTFSPFDTVVLSGSHTLICTVQRVAGGGAWNVSSSGNYLRAGIRLV